MHPYLLEHLAADKQKHLLRHAADDHLASCPPTSRFLGLRWRSGHRVIDSDLAKRCFGHQPVTLHCWTRRCCHSLSRISK